MLDTILKLFDSLLLLFAVLYMLPILRKWDNEADEAQKERESKR